MSSPGGSTYVPEDEVYYGNEWRIFDGRLSYNKGAAILHMLRFEFQDDDLFFDALHQYTEQYAGSTATGADFRDKMAEVSGLDLTDFFDQWYYGQGYPTYSVVWSQNGNNFYFESTQTTSYPSATPLFKMLMAYELNFTDGTDTTIYVQQTENVNAYSISVSEQVSSVVVDPDNWVINHVGSITTGVSELDNPVSFTFGPNPVQDKLKLNFINNDNSQKIIQVIDFKGSVVKTQQSSETSVLVNVGDLNVGTYIITASSKGNLITKKFVKVD
jgi:hypothetical protein